MRSCIDGLLFYIAVPTVISIWEIAMIDEVNSTVDSANSRVRPVGKSVRLDNATK